MKFKSLLIAILVLATTTIIIPGCKKTNLQNDNDSKSVYTQLADSTMFVSTLDTSGTNIYVLNASNGSVTTKYHYPYDAKAKWSAVSAGNGFLYDIGSNKINAINMNTGSIEWTDAVDNSATPVLHDNTFYGLYSATAGTYGIYALDATKPTKTYLWKAQITGETRQNYLTNLTPTIKYYNGVIYIMMDRYYVTALDAKTGATKWAITAITTPATNSFPYDFTSLNNGLITLVNTVIDATSGTQFATVTPPVIPATPDPGSQLSVTQYASNDLYFVETYHFYTPEATKLYLSAIDRTTGVEKWRATYGGGFSSYDTVNNVTQVWNNKLLINKTVHTGAGKYGVNTADSHWLVDINTGSGKVNIDDGNKGTTVSSNLLGSTIYFNKRFESTLQGLPFGSNSPPVNYLLANDLATGKQKWDDDKLFTGYTGGLSYCVYSGGKGYSEFIQ